MIGALHRFRRDEEGQALLLAAIFGLVLMLCVLGTVNLGRAVRERMQLQTAADAAAYSQAALEARVLNFTAYVNRAMVVHTASVLAASALLTWVHFLYGGMQPLLHALKFVPGAGALASTFESLLRTSVTVLDTGVALLTPLLGVLNASLYALQEGAWAAMLLRLSKGLPPEAHSGDSVAHPYVELWPGVIEAANAAVFSRTRGHVNPLLNVRDSGRILLNHPDPAVQEARLHMVEIINSARDPWVAYGGAADGGFKSPLARHFKFKFGVRFETVARTEFGIFPPGPNRGATANTSQVWSGQRLEFTTFWRKLGEVRVFQLVTLDQLFAPRDSQIQVMEGSGVVGTVLSTLLAPVGAAMRAAALSTLPKPDTRSFGLAPYVFFHASDRSTPQASGDLGNFGQPDVLIGLGLPGASDTAGSAGSFFARRFAGPSSSGPTAGAVDFRHGAGDAPAVAGLPLFQSGFNAFAAAQVVYHRPGEWREMPNFFNPLWSARLLPVLESNAAAQLGLPKLPLLQQLLLH